MKFKKISLLLIVLLVAVLAIGSATAADADSYVLNDTTYDSYFDKGGHFVDSVNDNTTFIVGNLTNKELTIDRDGISLIGDNYSIQQDITIRLGVDGDDYTSFVVKNLNIQNTKKIIGIIVQEGVSNALIADNYIYLNSNAGTWDSVMGIVAYGNCCNLTIEGNLIEIDSNGGYVYGIDSSTFKENYAVSKNDAFNYIIKNNAVIISGTNSMASGIYLDQLVNGIVEDNFVNITSTGGDNYGISMSKSLGNYEAPKNITISENILFISGNNMVFGISNYGVNDVTIDSNLVMINSTGGCFAITSKGKNTVINDNILDTEFGSLQGISTYDSFGAGNQSVYVMQSSNVVVTNNIVKSENKDWLKSESNTNLSSEFNIVADNIRLLDDITYNESFDDNGYLKESVLENTVFLVGNLTNKSFTIDMNNISLVGVDDCTQSDITIYLGDDSDNYSNLVVKSLNIVNLEKFVSIIVNEGVSNALLQNNKILINYTAGSWDSVMAIVAYGNCNNLTIDANDIEINTNGGYVYAIDTSAYKADYSEAKDNAFNYTITNNSISIEGTAFMAEGIYLDELINGLITNNIIYIEADGGDNYGISISKSLYYLETPRNITISDNTVSVVGNNMVYGIENGGANDVNIENNFVSAQSTGGCYAIASKGNEVVIDSNTVSTVSGSLEGISTWDAFGVGNQSVYVMDSAYVNITNNNIYSNNINWLKDASVKELYLNNNTMNIDLVVVNQTKYYGYDVFEVALYSGLISIPDQDVTISINGVDYNRVTDEDGKAYLDINLDVASYDVAVTACNLTENANWTVLSTLECENLVLYYKNGSAYEVKVVDSEGNPAVNQKVIINIVGKDYTKTTDVNGVAKLNINLAPGNYPVTITNPLNDEKVSYNVTVLHKLITDDIEIYYKSGAFTAMVVDGQGNPVTNKQVIINIVGKDYTKVTDEKGIARLNVNLAPGTYTVITKDPVTGESVTNTVTVKSTLKTHDVELYKGNPFTAKVVDGNGNPLAGASVVFNIFGKDYTKVTDENGIARLNINSAPGTYAITTKYNGLTATNKITVKSSLETHDVELYYKSGAFTAKVVDANGDPLAKVNVVFNIFGKDYTKVTDENGIASLNINSAPGTYSITTKYNGITATNKITVKPTLIGKDVTLKYKDGTQYKVQVLDGQGKPLENAKVKMNIVGKDYYKITDATGTASLNINLGPGTYDVTAEYNGLVVSNKVIVKA